MSIKITNSREGGGGHRRFDFEIDAPKTGGKRSEILRKGFELERAISDREAGKPSPALPRK